MGSWNERETARLRALDKRANEHQAGLSPSPLPWHLSWAGHEAIIRDANGKYVCGLGAIVSDYTGEPSDQPVVANAQLILDALDLMFTAFAGHARLDYPVQGSDVNDWRQPKLPVPSYVPRGLYSGD